MIISSYEVIMIINGTGVWFLGLWVSGSVPGAKGVVSLVTNCLSVIVQDMDIFRV